MIFASVITVLQHISAGKLRAIATTQTTRYEGLPDVPTMAETLEGFDMSSWLGFLGPAHLPDAVARRLSEEVIKSLNDPEVKAKLVAGGLVVVASSAASFASQIRRDFDLRGKLIEQAGIKAE
jgi:tripartite-type tricarboxylate transporter receptor subunit TctC